MSEPNEDYNEDMIQIVNDANKTSMKPQSQQIADEHFGIFGRRRRHGIIYKVIGGLAFIGIVGFGLFYVDNSSHSVGANTMDERNQEGRDLAMHNAQLQMELDAFKSGLTGMTEEKMKRTEKKKLAALKKNPQYAERYEQGRKKYAERYEQGRKLYFQKKDRAYKEAQRIMDKWTKQPTKYEQLEYLEFEQMMKGYFNTMAYLYGMDGVKIEKVQKESQTLADELNKLRIRNRSSAFDTVEAQKQMEKEWTNGKKRMN